MATATVRPFRRSDRDQLTDLVNAHAQAVLPGVSISVNAVVNQLEREPGEFIVDPWVDDRATLVAEQRGRISAAAHLVRYGGGPDVGADLRRAGEIRWLLQWPDAPRRRGVATALLACTAEWLRLGRIDRVLAYAAPDDVPLTSFLARSGFTRLTTSGRGWARAG